MSIVVVKAHRRYGVKTVKLAELLNLLRESILNDRTDRIGGTSDYLWTDTMLITYINEAQRRFAVKGLVLRDGTTEDVTKITLVAGQTEYTLHKAVIAVISAKRSDQQADLNRVGHSLLGAYRAPTDNWVDPISYIGLPPGPPLAFSTDEQLIANDEGSVERVSLRVYPVPRTEDAGTIIRLRVVRKPISVFTVADLEEPLADQPSPEIPEDHHIEMLDWAAYLALRIVDDDAGSPRRAAEFAQTFEEHVRMARTTAMRKMFAPMPWGFGRGGFSWGN